MTEEKKDIQFPEKNQTGTVNNKQLNIDKKTIDIPEEQLGALLDTNKALMERVDRLESAANKAGLARYDSKNKERRQKKVSLVKYDGKIVQSWSDMIKNRVEKNVQTKNWEEEQIIEITFFEDEKPVQLHYETFNRNYTKVDGIVIKESINMGEEEEKMGNRTFVVQLEDGKKYTLGKKFVN